MCVCSCCVQVRDGLVPLIAELRSKGTPPDDAWLKGKFSVEKQVRSMTTIMTSHLHCVVLHASSSFDVRRAARHFQWNLSWTGTTCSCWAGLKLKVQECEG